MRGRTFAISADDRPRGRWAALAVLVLVSAVVRALAARSVAGPWFTPDEIVYSELGRSLYGGGHFEILGSAAPFFSAVYPALIGLPLDALDPVSGYRFVQGAQGLVMSLVAVPVYCWGRTLVSPGRALAAAALTLCMPYLALSGFLMTEVASLPLFVLAAWLIARALSRATIGNQALAVGSVALLTLTRLQAIVLVPAFALAVVIEAALARRWSRAVRLWPSFAAFGVIGIAWLAAVSLSGGRPLGAYDVAVGGPYEAGKALRFIVYHAADLVFIVAAVPILALVVLLQAAVRTPEPSSDVRAFLAVSTALTTTVVISVGLYASRFLGRVGERYLFSLVPLFFLALMLWHARGAPRPRSVLGFAAAACVALLVTTPWDRLASTAAQPDALSFVPVVTLHRHLSGVDPGIWIVATCILFLVLALFLPARALVVLPLLVAVLVGAIAVMSSRFVGREASAYQTVMVGEGPRWIDDAAQGQVTYLYGNELSWSQGGPAWMNLFWNQKVGGFVALFGSRIAGPSSAIPATVAGDGRILSSRAISTPYVVAPLRLILAGEPIASSSAGLVLWRIDGDPQLLVRKDGVRPNGVMGPVARLYAYACGGGTVRLALTSPTDRTVTVSVPGVRRTITLGGGTPWVGSFDLERPALPGREPCTLTVRGASGARADTFDFVPAG
jgi:hypothetical protein